MKIPIKFYFLVIVGGAITIGGLIISLIQFFSNLNYIPALIILTIDVVLLILCLLALIGLVYGFLKKHPR